MIFPVATVRERRVKRRWKIFGSRSASISLRNPRLKSALARGSRAKKSASSSMPKLPGVNHLAAVRALEKIGFIHNPTGQAYHAERWLADGANTARKPGTAAERKQRNRE